MRLLFAIFAVLLAVVATFLKLSEPQLRSEIPVIYWTIDPNPMRGKQIELFHEWQIRKGHSTNYKLETMFELQEFRNKYWSENIRNTIFKENPDGKKVWNPATDKSDLPIEISVPVVEMRLDASGNDLNKKLVQGVSGIAGDVIEAYDGGRQMQYFAAVGLLEAVDDKADEMGYSLEQTFGKLRPCFYYRGKQYGVPRNPTGNMYWVNKQPFKRHGVPLPPQRWTIEQFEKHGREFVKAANPPGERVKVFFANEVPIDGLRRSMGLSIFNETLTKCTLEDPRYVKTLELLYKWTYEDHLLPSAADMASFDTAGGWGGKQFQLFKRGNYALFLSGRWAVIKFRQFGKMDLAVVEPPHAEMPNMKFAGGVTTIYRNSPNKDLARLFLAFMFSKEYCMHIVKSGDGLPPNPEYTETKEFLRPPDHPNEWGCHETFLNAAKNIGIVQSFSPYVLPVVVQKIEHNTLSEVMNDRTSPQEAAAEAEKKINLEIKRTLSEFKDLRKEYDRQCNIQTKINRLRSEGKPVPLEWIKNPFHRQWYIHKGWAKISGETQNGS